MPKRTDEIVAITNALRVTIGAFVRIEAILAEAVVVAGELQFENKPLTAEWLQAMTLRYFLDRGYHCPVQPDGMIIAGGMKTAEPHYPGAGVLAAQQPIVVDLFPQHIESGYFADVTRTYVKGEPPERLCRMYEAVAAAQAAVFLMLQPGVACKAVYERSAEVLIAHGFDVGAVGYVHSLGHGVGQVIHDAPHLSARSDEVLQVGDVITIEPGLYYPDIGGVRIEDAVVITATGYENLTNHPIDHWVIA